MRRLTSIAVFIFSVLSTSVGVCGEIQGFTKYQSFNKAKKILLKKVYHDHRVTFYCGCEFTSDKKVNHSNGYKPKKKWKRTHRLEWEHVVPAHAFGQSFKEWREGIHSVLIARVNPLKAGTAPGRWRSHSGIWNPICTIGYRQSAK